MKLNLLWILDRNKYYIKKMSRVRFHGIAALGKLANVTLWGPNWRRYDTSLTLEENMKNEGFDDVDGVICYKPVDVIGFENLKCLKIMTYNEMWDEPYTLSEINGAKPDLVVCHHENDMMRYKTGIYNDLECYFRFVHIHHCAEKTVFYDRKQTYDTDVLLCGSIGRHYPLRQRLRNVIKLMPKKYICREYSHPGYIHDDAFTDYYLRDFAENMSRAKICITCSSRYKYLMGKYIETPMCGSVLAADIPGQDHKLFEEMLIVLDESMTDQEMADKLTYFLENPEELDKKRKLGVELSKGWGQERYGNLIHREIQHSLKTLGKIRMYVQGEDIDLDEKWICDVLRDEFAEFLVGSSITIVDKIEDCDIVWLFCPWKERRMNKKLLKEKFVVTTIHHIDWDKYESFKDYYTRIDSFTNRYHCICTKTEESLKKITKKPIIVANLWINPQNYFDIPDKASLRKKYNLPSDTYIVGSFQKDTEGKGENLPKLSKGPDVFVKIIEDMVDKGKKVMVLLTGWRRGYVISKLKEMNVPYRYHELVNLGTLNELYNCLDLYIVASRVEGGPRSVMECGLTRTPLITTNVGIADLIVHGEGMFDPEEWESYEKAYPDVDHAYRNTMKYTNNIYIPEFISKVFYEAKL